MSPMKVDTSLERDKDGAKRRTLDLDAGKAAAGSSGAVTVYEYRGDGMVDAAATVPNKKARGKPKSKSPGNLGVRKGRRGVQWSEEGAL